jgi:hypothetical protein
MSLHTRKKLWGNRLMSGFVVVAMLLVSFGPVFPVKRAEAIPATIIGGIGTIQETISAGANTAISAFQSSLNLKEFVLDNIAWALINTIIQQMSQSIVTWINSGFEGSPAFVTDLEGFLTGVADKVAGEYIWGSGLNFLCSPFKLNVQIALDIQYRQARSSKGVQCTLSGVLNNVQNFAEAPINDWDSWFQVALKPQNNVYGAMLLAQADMGVTISNAQGKQVKLLEFGKGFFSKQSCEKIEGREICKTVTPGTTIENQLNTALDLPAGRLVVADEINEILGALFAQLAKQAISGVGGLLGLTKQGGGGQGSYFDQINNDTATDGFISSGNPLEDSIQFEGQWRSLHEQGMALIEDAQTYVDRSCMAGTSLPRNLELKLSDLEFEIMETDLIIDDLTTMTLEYTNATAAVKADIMQEYLLMQSQGNLHTEPQIYAYKMIDLADIQTAVNSYKSSIDNACRQNETGAGA